MYLGDTIRGVAAGLFGIFAPVYLFGIFRDAGVGVPVAAVFLYYAVFWFLATVGMYHAVKYYSRLGFRTIIFLAFGALAAHVVALALAAEGVAWLGLALIFGAAFSALFWPAYHMAFARAATEGRKAAAVGTRAALFRLGGIVSPLIGGMIIMRYGFPVLFMLMLGLLLLAAIPYATIEMRDGHRGGVRPLLREFRRNHGGRAAAAFAADGATIILAADAWPLFLVMIGVSFSGLGAIATVAALAAVTALFWFGRLADRVDRGKLLHGSSFAYMGGWVLRVFSVGIFSAFIAETVASLAGGLSAIPRDAYSYDRVGGERDPHQQVHLVLFREISLNAGRILGALVIAGLVLLGVELRWVLLLGIPTALLAPLVIPWGTAAADRKL